MTFCITYDDIISAKTRLAGHAKRTPLISNPTINAMAGMQVHIKLENEQKVGAFKYRGAFNRLSAMTVEERKRGVVAYSSGNHAQGVSRAAQELGINATIVMPTDAPKIKVAGVKRDGANIVIYDRMTESREDIAAEISKSEGRLIVPSYDDPFIMAGQGTMGLEVAEDAPKIDAMIICMGGGGLCAGSSIALHHHRPDVKIFGAEPVGYNDHQLSLRAGKRIELMEFPPSICDALQTPVPGELTFPINKEHVTDVFAVTDLECLLTMAVLKKATGTTGEPGGVVALASVLSGKLKSYRFKSVAVVISGGNVDPDVMSRAEALLG